MHRREFLVRAAESLLVLPFGTFLVRCGGSTDIESSTTSTNATEPGEPPAAPPRVEGGDAIYTSSQTYVHAHAFAIAQAVLLSPPADGISGSSTEIEQHAHTVTITQAELQAVAALQAVRVRTGDALGHNHVFTIVKVA